MKILPWGTTLADCEREARENGLPGAAGRLVVARNYGFFTWRRLEDYIDHPAGLSNFLQLACLQYFPTDSPAHRERARAMLSGDPALAQRDIWSAACCRRCGNGRRFSWRRAGSGEPARRLPRLGTAHLELLLEYGLNAEHRANWLLARDGELVPNPDRTLSYQASPEGWRRRRARRPA